MSGGTVSLALVRELTKTGEFPSTLEGLCLLVGHYRGRSVVLREIESTRGPFPVSAQWFSMGNDDLVLHLGSDSELYRERTVCHELAHMLLGHDPRPLGCSDDKEEADAEALGAELVRLIRSSRSRESSWGLVFVA